MCKKLKKLELRRYFIPVVFIPFLFFIEEVRTYVYIPVIMGVSSFFFFWNFQYFVYYTASKPLYYEDLFIDEKKLPNYNVDIKIKKKFELILKWILIVSYSLLVSALSEFWFYKIQTTNSLIEIAGITGGIVKVFQIINNTITRYMLKILRRFIKEESRNSLDMGNQVNMVSDRELIIRERSGTI